MGYVASFARVDRATLEKNDCVVRAYSNATGMDYFEAHDLFKAAGRKDLKGTAHAVYVPIYNEVGTFYAVHTTVGQFLRDHAHGTWIIRIKGHVFAVRDGVTMDTGPSKERTRVVGVWQIHVQHADRPIVATPPKKRMSVQELLAQVQRVKIATPKPEEQSA